MRRGLFRHKRGHSPRTHVTLFAAAAAASMIASARADDAHPIDSIARALNLKTDVGSSPDFIETSRPKAPPDFLPVGTKHTVRTIKVKTPAEIKASEAELDGARMRQDALSGRKPPDGTAAVPRVPAKPKSHPPHSSTQN